MLNGVFTFYATNEEIANIGAPQSSFIRNCEIAFLIFYSIELGLKLGNHRLFFFINEDMRWNLFDFLLVGISLFDAIANELTADDDQSFDITFMRLLRLLKLAKIMRMVRVMRLFAELRVILNSVMGSFMALFWAGVGLAFIYCIFGIIFVQASVPSLMSGAESEATQD